jgi:hypothetical protein
VVPDIRFRERMVPHHKLDVADCGQRLELVPGSQSQGGDADPGGGKSAPDQNCAIMLGMCEPTRERSSEGVKQGVAEAAPLAGHRRSSPLPARG